MVAVACGFALGVGDLAPSWPSAGWLITLALTSQVVGWLLITVSLPRLPAAMTSIILTIQPIGSVALGAVLLGQEPSVLQLCGVTLILAGLISVAMRNERARPAVAEGPAARFRASR
jgi:drug/metabolite transporter (DMT)-like permease